MVATSSGKDKYDLVQKIGLFLAAAFWFERIFLFKWHFGGFNMCLLTKKIASLIFHEHSRHPNLKPQVYIYIIYIYILI